MGMAFPQAVPHGLMGGGDGVMTGILTVTPAVEDKENQWLRDVRHILKYGIYLELFKFIIIV